jgi:hypothetical protein
LSLPLAANAQPQAKMPRIAYIAPTFVPISISKAFWQGLRDLGYVGDQHVAVEYHWLALT